MRVPNISFTKCLVIASSSNRSRAENVVEIVSVWLLLNPFSDRVKHIPVDFKAFISQSWVMKNPENIIHNLVNRDSRVLPAVDYTSEMSQSLNKKYLLALG